MFKNLLEYESGVECYIQYIETAALEKRLATLGLKRDVAIVKKTDAETSQSITVSSCDGDVIIKKETASHILVRACDVCWSCGNCGSENAFNINL